MVCNPMKFTTQQVLKVVFVFFALLVLSAFYIEYVLEVAPCKMCWWQRYTHWMITGFAAFALVMSDAALKKRALMAILLTAIVSLGVGAYQSMGQLELLELPLSCTGGAAALFDNLADPADLMATLQSLPPQASCTDTSFTIFGLTLAGWNVLSMTIVSAVIAGWLFVNRSK